MTAIVIRRLRTRQATVPGSAFSPQLVMLALEPEGRARRHLDLTCALDVTELFRAAVLSYSNDLPGDVQGLVSGHPLESPHLGFFPLPHAQGRIAGVAVAIPDAVSSQERNEVLRAVSRVRHLALGRLGGWKVLPPAATPQMARSFGPEAWTAHPAGATHWSTVTPLVYDRHPKAGGRGEVAAMIAEACERIGLPRPREAMAAPTSAHLGIPPAHAFPRLRRKDGSERRHTHVILAFDQPVRGPVLVGAGRYRGYGLCRPWSVDGP